MILAFMVSKIRLVRNISTKNNISRNEKIALSVIFGLFGIIGTYTGVPIEGALANSRIMGIVVGGLLGGPTVGILAGLIAGIHRFLIDMGGFTTIACTISTIFAGIISGTLSKEFHRNGNRWVFAMVTAIIPVFMELTSILLFSKPFSEAFQLVKIIALPILVTNTIGAGIFVAIIDNVIGEQERAAAYQAQMALKIANRTLKYFRKGFNMNTALKTAQIIKEMTEVKGVAFTDRESILAHVGLGEDHHRPGDHILTGLTKEVIHTGVYKVASTKEEINCSCDSCKLRAAIIVPLKEGSKVIGTLKLYKDKEDSITQVDMELALGLGLLFSTQIELSKIDYQYELLSKAELRALQAQINPHFLFNAINTIVSFTRTDPDTARDLLIHLGSYFRKNLQQNVEEVSIFEEIEHIKSYVEIEKARFGDKLNVKFNIPKDIKCTLPPLILQPIVENGIKHGILEQIEGGNIEVKAVDHDDVTTIVIKDDGVGMEKDFLNSLFKNKPQNDSIGLINVNNRLKNKYGEKNGLTIYSKVGKGTTVIIRIPK